jgi:DNA-binding response OmpR family regulator
MSKRLSVLLVEDDDPLRDVLLELLRQRGWNVHAAARGDEALELARRVSIDLSIMDFHLPGLTGLEVYRRITREVRPLPSIMISGDATRAEVLRALDSGFVDFLRKPLDLATLRKTLDALVRRHFGTLADQAGTGSQPGDGRPALPLRLEDLYPLLRRRGDRGNS